jgi:Family of unknown function (DUF6247)
VVDGPGCQTARCGPTQVFERLTPAGQRKFIKELMESLEASVGDDDLRPLQRVLLAWYRTLILRSDPQYRKNLQAGKSGRGRGKALTVADVRARFIAS